MPNSTSSQVLENDRKTRRSPSNSLDSRVRSVSHSPGGFRTRSEVSVTPARSRGLSRLTVAVRVLLDAAVRVLLDAAVRVHLVVAVRVLCIVADHVSVLIVAVVPVLIAMAVLVHRLAHVRHL